MRLKSLEALKAEISACRTEQPTAALEKIQILEEGGKNNIKPTIQQAVAESGQNENEILLICGSFFIMTDVRLELGLIEANSASIDFI